MLSKIISRVISTHSKYSSSILTGLWKFDHITPALKELYWLQVQYRITFRILLLVYKHLKVWLISTSLTCSSWSDLSGHQVQIFQINLDLSVMNVLSVSVVLFFWINLPPDLRPIRSLIILHK